MGDGSNVPRAACHGAHKEAACVVNEVGDNHFYELLWELGDSGRTFCRCIWGTSIEKPEEEPLDFGFGSVPNLVNK